MIWVDDILCVVVVLKFFLRGNDGHGLGALDQFDCQREMPRMGRPSVIEMAPVTEKLEHTVQHLLQPSNKEENACSLELISVSILIGFRSVHETYVRVHGIVGEKNYSLPILRGICVEECLYSRLLAFGSEMNRLLFGIRFSASVVR